MAVKKTVEAKKKPVEAIEVEEVKTPVYCTSCKGTGRIPPEGFANLSECGDCNGTGLK